jgi:hypothetical protein
MIVFLLLIASAAWVYMDARSLGVRRGLVSGLGDMSPVGWFIATIGIWIVALPAYLYYRGEFKRAIANPEGVASTVTPQPTRLSGWSVAAFYSGLLSILVIPTPIAIFTGIMALRDIGKDPTKAGKGRAIFGIVAGLLFLALLIIGMLSARNRTHG